VTIEVEWDTKDVEIFLSNLEAGIPDAIGEVLISLGEATFSWSQDIVHVVTGNLKKSGGRARTAQMEFTIFYTSPYAGYVEWGTSKMSPKPYLRPAWAIVRGKARAIAKAALERVIREAK